MFVRTSLIIWPRSHERSHVELLLLRGLGRSLALIFKYAACAAASWRRAREWGEQLHVGEAHAMAEFHGIGVAAVFRRQSPA